MTSPDTANGRRFYPYDPWFWLAADNLHTFERSKMRIGGDGADDPSALLREPLPAHDRRRSARGRTSTASSSSAQVNDEKRKWTLKLTYALIALQVFPDQRLPRQRAGRHDRLPGAARRRSGGRQQRRRRPGAAGSGRSLRRARQHQLLARQQSARQPRPRQVVAR